MGNFIEDFMAFLFSTGVDVTDSEVTKWLTKQGGTSQAFDVNDNVRIVAVSLDYFKENSQLPLCGNALYVFEDRWRHSAALMKGHILSHIGQGRSVFARNCEVRSLSSEEAACFMAENHIYGTAKSKYRYGLFRLRKTGINEMSGDVGELVAAASFSGAREVTREGASVQSYEWVRYASIPGVRVVGGMGKLLKAFIEEVHPQDIMSYSDIEWSDGSVYEKLGFRKIGNRAPVNFVVNPETMERISLQKVGRDKKYISLNTEKMIRIQNLGSDKWCLVVDMPLRAILSRSRQVIAKR